MNDNKDRIKPSFDEDRQVLGEIYPLSTPFNVILDSSEACNFRCSYCFRSDMNKRNWGYAGDCQLMNWETFVRSFEGIMGFPTEVRQVSLSNHGEPLCNRELPRMISYMRHNGYKGKISIHTNGSLLDHEYSSELIEAGLSRIVFSIQGMRSEKYEKVCGIKCDIDELVDNITHIYNVKEQQATQTQIDVKIADVALEDGDENLFYKTFLPIADKVFVERIVPIWKNVSDGNSFATEINKYGETFPKQKCCPLIFHTIVMSPAGDIYPCTQLLNDNILGNIYDQSLVDCWNGEKRQNLLKSILKLDTPQMCEGCFILQNSIFSEKDMIDDYRAKILFRMN